jgi:hypothetical protein
MLCFPVGEETNTKQNCDFLKKYPLQVIQKARGRAERTLPLLNSAFFTTEIPELKQASRFRFGQSCDFGRDYGALRFSLYGSG